MAQVVIYGHRPMIEQWRGEISDGLQAAAVDALGPPADKRFHRFVALAADDFVHPSDRSGEYLIVEVSMFAGRSRETRKAYLRAILKELSERCGIAPQDLEVTITETPRENWLIRGVPGDELGLTYQVEV